MEIFITSTKYNLASGVKKVTAASGDYLAKLPTLTIVSNESISNET